MQLFLPFRSWEEGEWQKKKKSLCKKEAVAARLGKGSGNESWKCPKKKSVHKRKFAWGSAKCSSLFSLPPSSGSVENEPLLLLSQKMGEKRAGETSLTPDLTLLPWVCLSDQLSMHSFYSHLGKKCCIPAAEEICNCPPSPLFPMSIGVGGHTMRPSRFDRNLQLLLLSQLF